MISRRLLLRAAAMTALSCGAGAAAQAQTEIQWWHAMGGQLGETLNALADGFNKSQKDYKVAPVYKGTYTETMTAAIAAFRARQQPHIVQVFEVGTATMMAARGAIYPVHQLMADAGESVRSRGLSAGGLRLLLHRGRQAAVDAVQFLDARALLQQGCVPEGRPRPQCAAEDLAGPRATRQEAAGAGSQCGFTSQWQTWVQIENFGAWHNIPFATGANGFAGNRHQARDQRSAARSSRRQPRQVAEGQGVRLRRARGQAEPEIHHRRVPDDHGVGRLGRRLRAGHEGRAVRHRHAAVLCGRERRAAEFHHRRGDAVGAERKAQGRVQGRRQVLRLPVEPRGAVEVAHGHRLRADHQGGLSAHPRAGLLRQVSRVATWRWSSSTSSRRPTIPRACASAISSRSATSWTRSSKRCGPVRRRPSRRSTRRSSAATSCLPTSRVPTGRSAAS